MSSHFGDFDAAAVIYGKFTTYRPSTGATFTLGGTPALSVYKDNSTTQSTAGVTLTADFDSVTGLNHFAIDTSADGTFYAAGSFFSVVITTGTVDSVSVTGAVVAEFTLRKNSALKPTTAGRTLDVSAGGEAGIDWANIGSPTTAVNLSATNIDVDQVVASVSGAVGSVTGLTAATVHADLDDIQARLPAALVGGRIDANVGAISADATAADNLEAALDGTGGVTITAAVTGNITGNLSGSVGSVTGNVGGNVTGSVGSIATGGIADTSFAAGAINAAAIATDAFGALELAAGAASEIASAVRTELTTELGRIDTTVSSRASAADLTTLTGYVDTEVAAIKVVTDRLDTTLEAAGGSPGDWRFSADALTHVPTVDEIGDEVQTRTIAAVTNVTTVGTVNALANNSVTAAALAADAVTEIQSGLATAASLSTVAGYIDTEVASILAAVDTEVEAIKTVTDKVHTMLEPAGGSPGDYRFHADAVVNVADVVWDEPIAGHANVGSTGAALAAAGGSGDPWATALPGAYGAGTAGKIVGDYLDAAVSTRATQTSVDTIDDFLDTEVAAIKAKTDNLPSDPADASDIAASFTTVNTKLDTIDDFLDTEVAAIKAKTDNLPADPADASDIAASLTTITGYIDTEVAAILAAVDTEVAAIKAKTDNLPAAPAATGDIPSAASIADAVWDEATSGHLSAGSTGLALRSADLRGERTVIRGTVSGTAPGTTSFTASALTPAGVDANQFKGRIIVFDNDTTTTALRGQATDITASSAAALPLFTFSALTQAPAAGDTFSIV